MERVARTSASLVVAASLALLVACTAPTSDPPPTATATKTPTPTPAPVHSAEPRLPEQPTTVVDAADAVTRAVSTSSAFYGSAPVAVVAAPDDVPGQVRAASLAVALGAPLLLSSGAATDDPTSAELERLEVLAVLTVGAVDVDVAEDVAVVRAPSDDGALADLLRRELMAASVPTAGGELASVASLDRTAPTLLAPALVESPEPAESPQPAGSPEPAESVEPAESPQPTESPGPARSPRPTESVEPTASPEPDKAPDENPLPLTEQPAPLAGALLLTTGDLADLASVATARSVGVTVLTVPSGDPRADSTTVQALAAAQATHVVGLGTAFGPVDVLTWKVATAATGVELPGGGQILFPGRRFVALYGTPTYPALGLLGEQDAAASVARAQGLVAEYQTLTTDVVVPAFEMIVTVASAGPGDDGNYSNELPIETFIPWVEAAQAAGVYVVIDLQPGRTDFVTQAQLYEPLLKYPNVGLALDPEWRLEPDQVHLRQIGSVHVDEVNAVAGYLAQLTRDNRLPQKLLVLHQFMHRMIEGRELVTSTHPELAVLIHADGQGSQGAKAGTWASLHEGAPAGVAWGWKNFIDEDVPMLTPVQTYQVVPPPQFVSYQ